MACYQAIASIDKRRILEIHSNGGDFLTLARSLGIKRTTAYTIMRRGREENLSKGGSHNRKINDEIRQHAVEILEGNPMLTLKQLNHAIGDKVPSKPQFTDQALSKALEGRMITTKIASLLMVKYVIRFIKFICFLFHYIFVAIWV